MRPESHFRIAITYHYSLSFGGSERVLEVLARLYPKADFFALAVDPAFLPESLLGRKITTSFLDRIPGGKRMYRQLLPLYPLAVECLDLSGYDLVISADGAATKGVLTDQHAVHLCYCHSPPRSYWDQYSANRRTMPWFARAVFAPVSQYLRQWDFAAAQRIDGFIANSEYVAERVRKYYRRESTVIYPPVDVGGAWLAEAHEDFYLSVGRLVGSKRIDVIVDACNRLGRTLQIAGTGPEEIALRGLAGPTIEFLGRIGETELKEKYAACRALLFAANEDFGLVSVEAQAFGRPVIAYGRGGSLETVRGVWARDLSNRIAALDDEEYTGLFFSEQTADSLAAAILAFESIEERFDPATIRDHARRFDAGVFESAIRRYVQEKAGLPSGAIYEQLPTANSSMGDQSAMEKSKPEPTYLR
jgi:glycosyltransferase involved in cell wall biosynthesis